MTVINKRVFVTGATGFIGGHLARRLHEADAHVLALERTPGKGAFLPDGVEIVAGDITDHARMREIIAGDVDIVMHIAAWLRGTPLEKFEQVNVAATRNLAEASAAANVERFVYTSSIMVYGAHGDRDVDESEPLAEFGDPYGDSKIRSERVLWDIAEHTGLEVSIVRPGMVYGPRSRGWTVRIAKWAKAGRMPLVDGGRGSAYPVYIDNLCDLLITCATHPDAPGEAFNGVDDAPETLGEYLGAYMAMVPTNRAIRIPAWLMRLLAAVVNPFTPSTHFPTIAEQMIGTGRVLNDKPKRVLGWKPRIGPEESLRRSEAWLREAGHL